MTNSDVSADSGVGNQAEVAELRRQLAVERERSLNAVDARRGAEAEVSQLRAKIVELEHLLHLQAAELEEMIEMVSAAPGSSFRAVTSKAAKYGRSVLHRAQNSTASTP